MTRPRRAEPAGRAPAAPRPVVVIRAGSDGERTRRTLSTVVPGREGWDVVVVVVGDETHPLARDAGGRAVAFETRGASPPAALAAAPAGRPLVVVEDGALLPRGWDAIVERHFRSSDAPDAVAAASTHAPGPERVQLGSPPRRASPEAWQEVAAAVETRWRFAREDVELASTPLLALRDPARHRAALARWWTSEGEARIEFESDAVLSVAHDLAAWREPGRGRCFLGAEVVDPALPASRSAPLALVRLAREVSADDRRRHPRLQLRLAEALARLGDLPRAIEHALTCLEAWPRNVDARLWLAQAWTRSGELARARRAIAALQQEVPLGSARKAHLLACLGEVWRLGGDARQAEQCLDSALALDALQPLALDARGLIELEAGRFEASIRFFRQAVRSDPSYASAWSDYGRAQAMSGQLEGARSSLGRALALHPGNREARRLLARISPGRS